MELVIVVSITVERSKWTDKRKISLENVHDYILLIVVSICVYLTLSACFSCFFDRKKNMRRPVQTRHNVCNKINKKKNTPLKFHAMVSREWDIALHNRARFKYSKKSKATSCLCVYVMYAKNQKKKKRKISFKWQKGSMTSKYS